MKNATLGGILLASLALSATPALSADVTASEGSSTWSGFYMGVNAGYGFGETKHDRPLCVDSCDDGVLDDDFIDVEATDFDDFEAGGTFKGDLKGYLGGLQFGGNFVSNRLLIGAEASFSLSALAATINTVDEDWNIQGDPDFSAVMRDELSNLGFAEAKLGVANDSYVVYVRGGLALGELKSSLDLAGDDGASENFTLSSDTSALRAGWTVGGGLDIMVGEKTSLGFAYNYVDYGSELSSEIAEVNVDNSDDANGSIGIVERDISGQMHLVRASLNYHF
jgi:outer membrane immunogenic protein